MLKKNGSQNCFPSSAFCSSQREAQESVGSSIKPRFLDFGMFRNSIRVDDNFLWLSGVIRFGKAALAADLTKTVSERVPSGSVPWFFCKDTMYLGRSKNIVRSLLSSLSSEIRAKVIYIFLGNRSGYRRAICYCPRAIQSPSSD